MHLWQLQCAWLLRSQHKLQPSQGIMYQQELGNPRLRLHPAVSWTIYVGQCNLRVAELLLNACWVQCFVVATLASVTPAVPYIFRNYEYSSESKPPRAEAPPNDEASLYELGGSSKHLVWQAVRASSAAPYYLDDFVCGPDR